ncbi:MAG TPA: SufD family Fe-S cluster assembly protein [Nitrospira sp.]|jgi:Fe-S cluster assembly scaffold protein SufB|nr:SufD family Fe-S cluster assembly protein [Nitrospira sp.]HPV83940.1 SufD family Fe-S cluster assembly protein [Nitrospira sp.]
MSDLEELIRVLPMVGAESSILDDTNIAHVVAHGHHILSHRTVPGLRVNMEETPDAIIGKMIIDAGVTIAQPIHMCFGLAHPTGVQQIKIDVQVNEGAQARVLSHCLFPFAKAAEHRMQAVMTIGPGASLTYTEGHYHGPHGGMQVLPHATIKIGKGARYFSDFSLLSGSVGNLDIDYLVEVEEEGLAELSAKIFGHKTDRITLKESVILRGERSRSLIKTRVVLEGDASAEITGITEAHAKGARGHVDCMEIVQGQAHASAIPIVKVFHPEAKVTHEAAIGSVDKKELETLMARGLTPEQAVELIVSGMLR